MNNPNTIQGVQADQLPPYVAEMEADLFENMLANYKCLNGVEPSGVIVDCIQFLARAEVVRRYTYRKLQMARLDEYWKILGVIDVEIVEIALIFVIN